MPWVPFVDPEQATGKLAEIYATFHGEIDHVVQAHSQVPRAMEALMAFYRGVMHGPLDLTMTERETIAVTVSQVNECYYWVVHHSRGLLRHCEDEAFVQGLQDDPATVATTPKLRALLDYVIKLTRTPGRMRRSDVEALRAAGYSDNGIVGINQITGFFAWCNRTVDGLGVELEDTWPEEVRAANPHPPD